MKIFVLLVLFATYIFASYEKVEAYYKDGKYQKAINEAKISTLDYSNPKLHLLWAKSAEALGKLKEAMSAYERVVMLNDDVKVKFTLVKIYKQTLRNELADETIEELQNSQLTFKQKALLKDLQKSSEKRWQVETQASLNVGYDTNINVSATGSILDDYGLQGGEIATLFSRFNGGLSYIYNLENKGGWYIRSDLNIYEQNNQNAHYYDMLIIGINAGLGYTADKYSIYIPVSYDMVNYLDVDLLNQIKIEPQINVALKKDLVLKALSKYSYRDYVNITYNTLADSSYGLGLNLRYMFAKDYAYVGIDYEKFSSSNKIHPKYVDKGEFDFVLGVQHEINSLLFSKLEYRFRKISYADTINDLNNPTTTIKREDSYNQIELKLFRPFLNKYELFVLGKYMKNNSSNALSGYTKNVMMFGISGSY